MAEGVRGQGKDTGLRRSDNRRSRDQGYTQEERGEFFGVTSRQISRYDKLDRDLALHGALENAGCPPRIIARILKSVEGPRRRIDDYWNKFEETRVSLLEPGEAELPWPDHFEVDIWIQTIIAAESVEDFAAQFVELLVTYLRFTDSHVVSWLADKIMPEPLRSARIKPGTLPKNQI